MFLTTIAEVESLLNTRPLTHLSVDPHDSVPLTPNHLLIPFFEAQEPLADPPSAQLADKHTFTHQQVIMKHFWRRWLKEYTPRMTERRKWTEQVRNLRVNDVVLIIDENSPRGKWPTGRVTAVRCSDDGVVRSATVKTKNGEYLRPVAKLCILITHDDIDHSRRQDETKSNRRASIKTN